MNPTDIEALRVVRVLDAWAKEYERRAPSPTWVCPIWSVVFPATAKSPMRFFEGPTPDAARKAAADAIAKGEV